MMGDPVLVLLGLQETAQIYQAAGSKDSFMLLFSSKGKEKIKESMTGKRDRKNESKSTPCNGGKGCEHV